MKQGSVTNITRLPWLLQELIYSFWYLPDKKFTSFYLRMKFLGKMRRDKEKIPPIPINTKVNTFPIVTLVDTIPPVPLTSFSLFRQYTTSRVCIRFLYPSFYLSWFSQGSLGKEGVSVPRGKVKSTEIHRSRDPERFLMDVHLCKILSDYIPGDIVLVDLVVISRVWGPE